MGDECERRTREDDDHRRLVRLESKLTNIMSHFGVDHKRDVECERSTKVFVVDGDVHALSPDAKVTWLYDAMLDAGLASADLYVSGVHRGRIILDAKEKYRG